MTRILLLAFLTGITVSAADPAWTAKPLLSRALLPDGAKPFETLDSAAIGLTVPIASSATKPTTATRSTPPSPNKTSR
jgi:hypothetical protein